MSVTIPRTETSYDNVVALVDSCRLHPERGTQLVSFLDERSACYAGRGTDEVDLLRGYILGCFAVAGTPSEALPYILEELESGIDPYTVAGAARALRGCAATSIPDESAILLLRAIRRIRSKDRYVAFEQFGPSHSLDGPYTALRELIRTLAWLGQSAASTVSSLKEWIEDLDGSFSDAVQAEMVGALRHLNASPLMTTPAPCCTPKKEGCSQSSVVAPRVDVWAMDAEDQDGNHLKIGDFLLGRPFVLSFFYTRCTNPEKCSLTITKLAQLQEKLGDQRASACTIAAFTYDPDFDVPFRLAIYGKDRGLRFGERVRLLRTIGSIEPLIANFDLAVGFGPVTINRHRSEIMVFDKAGRQVFACRRRAWDPEDILNVLEGRYRIGHQGSRLEA